MSSDERTASHQTHALELILETLEESDGEAKIDELKRSVYNRVREFEEERKQEVPLHFVPITGSDTPRSRSLNRSLKNCQGSGLIKREGETVALTDQGRTEIDGNR